MKNLWIVVSMHSINAVVSVSLASIGVLDTPVCHAQQAPFVDISPSNVLILKFSTINGCSAGAVALCNISSLYHEFVDDSVEGRHLVREPIFGSCAYRPKTSGMRC